VVAARHGSRHHVRDAERLEPADEARDRFHTLPYEELLAKLHSVTNLRAVRDSGSLTGWKIEAGPFAGWEKLPEW
jgi:hypothetical protein